MEKLIYGLDLFGVAVFAVTATLVGARKRMDVFGLVVVALVTALGGGTMRDLALGQTPVFWVGDPTYIVVAVIASVGCFALLQAGKPPERSLLIADAFGLAVFTVIGAQRAVSANAAPPIVVVMGVMTGCAGGITRDIFCNEIPLILRKEIYATASMAGAIVFVALKRLGLIDEITILAAIGVVLATRLAAIHWKLSLPTPHKYTDDKKPMD